MYQPTLVTEGLLGISQLSSRIFRVNIKIYQVLFFQIDHSSFVIPPNVAADTIVNETTNK